MTQLTSEKVVPRGLMPTGDFLPLHGLAALRILIIVVIGVGYASTMGIGDTQPEWGRLWGYDPSRYGVQLLFIFSGFLAARSMARGRTIGQFVSSRIRSLWPALIAATLVSVLVIYPVMCAPDAPVRMSVGDLFAYSFKTIFLIDPGMRMPGLMDDAKYMCLLQGAIWTLQWGLILHVGFLLGWLTRLLRHRRLTLLLSILATALYVMVIDTGVVDPDFAQNVDPIVPGLRLGYAYLIGVTLFQWQDQLRLNLRRILIASLVVTGLTCGFYLTMPWTSGLEVMGVLVLLTVCVGFLHTAPPLLQKCPRLAPMLYVSIWPAAQIVLAFTPDMSQFDLIKSSFLLAISGAAVMYLLLRETRIQPARL
jgi:hypothetical protein